jgi:hypothetical protein
VVRVAIASPAQKDAAIESQPVVGEAPQEPTPTAYTSIATVNNLGRKAKDHTRFGADEADWYIGLFSS